MSRPISTLLKFSSLTTLGLLTSSSLTLPLLALPPLLSLPSHVNAHTSFSILRRRTTRLQNALSISTVAGFVLAWVLAPRGGRHPYLLWSALPVVVIGGVDWWTGSNTQADEGIYGGKKEGGLGDSYERIDRYGGRKSGQGSGRGLKREREDSDEDEGEALMLEDVNGEVVRREMEGWGRRMGLRAAAWAIGWGVGLVGVWGDWI